MTRVRAAAWALGLAGLLAWTAGCATEPVPAVVPSAPASAEFVYPQPPPGAGDARAADQHAKAWAQLLRGDAKGAAGEFGSILKRTPGYVASQVGLGYALLVQRMTKEAQAWFEQAVRTKPSYAPALAGRAELWLALGQQDSAVSGFEAALQAAPGAPDVSRRLEVVRFGYLRELTASGRKAADEGRLDDARKFYVRAIEVSPDSAVLLRDLAAIDARVKDDPSAIAHLKRAVALDAGDARAFLSLGEALERQGDVVGALDAVERADQLDSSDGTRRAIARLREKAIPAGLPAELRSIGRQAQLTRGELAGLLGVRLPAWLASHRRVGESLATDLRGHWAAAHILAAIRAGVMEVYPNHTFQPGLVVSRGDAARVAARILSASGLLTRPASPIVVADVGADHLGYADVAAVVASGMMTLANGQFRPSRPLSGAEAVELVDRLERATKGKNK